MKLSDMLRRRSVLAGELKTLREKEEGLADGAAPEQADIDRQTAIMAEVSVLSASIERLQALYAAEMSAAEPVAEPVLGDVEASYQGVMGADGRITPHGYGEKMAEQAVAADPLRGKAFKMCRYAIGVYHAKQGLGYAGAAQFIERRFGDKDVAKALNTTGVSTGGALIPQAFSTDFIELLRSETVIRKLNPILIPMPGGNLTIPRMAAGAIAGFQGELDDISASQETFDDVQLNAKKLTALVPVSNDLIRRAPIGVEALVRDDLVQTTSRREDLAMMLGDGSLGSVIGLLNLSAATNKLTVNAFASTDNATVFNAVSATLFGMRLALKNNMSRMIRPAWIMSAGTEAFLMGLITQFGMYAYKDEMEGGKLLGIPYAVSQQLPTNINTGTSGSPVNNGSYLFLADFADVILAETLNVQIDASDVATYKDGGGNMVSGFVRDQTAFRIIEEFDFNLRHQASVAVAVLPGWAPAGFTPTAGAAYYTQALTNDMSAAPSTWGSAAPTGSNNPGNVAAVAPGGTLPGRP